jgi:ParB family chromosome partitioning protein
MSEMGRIKPDYQVPVKRVSDELAVEASYAENNELETMHPAEQITAFGTLAAQGKTPRRLVRCLGTVPATSSACSNFAVLHRHCLHFWQKVS